MEQSSFWIIADARIVLVVVALFLAGIIQIFGRDSFVGTVAAGLCVLVVFAIPLIYAWRYLVVRRRLERTGSSLAERDIL
jgi:hypothetical protein